MNASSLARADVDLELGFSVVLVGAARLKFAPVPSCDPVLRMVVVYRNWSLGLAIVFPFTSTSKASLKEELMTGAQFTVTVMQLLLAVHATALSVPVVTLR